MCVSLVQASDRLKCLCTCVCMCVCVYMCICMSLVNASYGVRCVCTCVCSCVCECLSHMRVTNSGVSVSVCVCICVCSHTRDCWTELCVYICVSLFIYMSLCLYICVSRAGECRTQPTVHDNEWDILGPEHAGWFEYQPVFAVHLFPFRVGRVAPITYSRGLSLCLFGLSLTRLILCHLSLCRIFKEVCLSATTTPESVSHIVKNFVSLLLESMWHIQGVYLSCCILSRILCLCPLSLCGIFKRSVSHVAYAKSLCLCHLSLISEPPGCMSHMQKVYLSAIWVCLSAFCVYLAYFRGPSLCCLSVCHVLKRSISLPVTLEYVLYICVVYAYES